MAGSIKLDMFDLPGVSVRDLVARECPYSKRYGTICQRYDPHSGEVLWCRYAYGLAVYLHGRLAADLRTPQDAAQWMATHELQETRQYQMLCLLAYSNEVAGATMPR